MNLSPVVAAARRSRLIGLSIALWLLAMAWNWPLGLSFGDEVGYVGQARLFLQGQIKPTISSPGIWHTTPSGGLVAKYPLFHPALLAPLIAISPRVAFLLGIVTAVVLVVLAARLLRGWGKDPMWAVLILVQPAITLVARTLMADLLLSAFLLGAYFAIRENRFGPTILLIAATLVAKPTGPVLAVLLIVGGLFTERHALRARDPVVMRKLFACGLGMALGIVIIVATNLIANGSPWYGYHERLGPPNFMAKFLLTSGVAHAKSLLLVPPLLFIGVWPYWVRRDYGPLAVMTGLVGLMAIYYFVDWGRNRVDSLVLSQRLILPAIVFLMIGYAALLSDLSEHLARLWGPWVRSLSLAGLLILPGFAGYEIAVRHRRWQEPMRQALAAVSEVASSLGTNRIALTPSSLKYGLMFHGQTIMEPSDRGNGADAPGGSAGGDHQTADVILCGTRNTSYRLLESAFSCAINGFRIARALAGCEILVRSERMPSK
jgi:hypothetical protein